MGYISVQFNSNNKYTKPAAAKEIGSGLRECAYIKVKLKHMNCATQLKLVEF